MSTENVKRVIGLLVTDTAFRNEFLRDPETALAGRQLELAPDQIAQLIRMSSISVEETAAEAQVLDDRIKRRSDDLI